MPKYYEYKIAGYYLYFTSYCVIECMHVHASDRKLTEAGISEIFCKKIMVIQYYKIGESLMTEKSERYKRLSNKTTRKCI